MKPLLLALPVLFTACVDDEVTTADHAAYLADGDTPALGVLALVNNATFDELDVGVGLDRRAARNIVDHRITDPIDSIAELDTIPYVGPTALDKLAAYADAHGWGQLQARSWCQVYQQLRFEDATSLEQLNVQSSTGGGFGFGTTQLMALLTLGSPAEIQIRLTDGDTLVSGMSATIETPLPIVWDRFGAAPANSGTFRLDIPVAYQESLGTIAGIAVVDGHMRCALWRTPNPF